MQTDQMIQPAQEVLENLRALPWAAHGLVVVSLISGLILWLYGRRVLKPMIVVVFALAGAAAGFVLPPFLPVGGGLSVYVGLAVGAGIGAFLGILLYRFAMAISLGLVLAIIAPIVGVVVLDARFDAEKREGELSRDEHLLRGVPIEDDDASGDEMRKDLIARGEKLRESLKDAAKRMATDELEDEAEAALEAESGEAKGEPDTDVLLRTATERVERFMVALSTEVRAAWADLPSRTRVTLAGSATCGLGLGILLGLLMPKWTAGAVTAMLGAAIWLSAGMWLLTASGLPIGDRIHGSASQWLITWAIASGLGMLIQWQGLMKRKKTKTVVVMPQQ